jgi:predicted esterase
VPTTSSSLDPTVFAVPKLPTFTVDGKTDDWARGGLQVNILTSRSVPMPARDDFDPVLRLGWTQQGLAVLLEVRDDRLLELDGATFWSADSAEVFLAGGWNTQEFYQLMIRPGLNRQPAAPVTHLVDKRVQCKVPLTVACASLRTPTGYTMELFLPWDSVGITATGGCRVAFTVQVNDVDAAGEERSTSIWYPKGWGSSGPSSMHRLVLSESASPAEDFVVDGTVKAANGHALVSVWGIPELAGVGVQVEGGGEVVCRTLTTNEGGRAVARLRVALPPPGQAWPRDLALRIAGHTVPLNLVPVHEARARELRGLKPRFKPYGFWGPKFPECGFEDPLRAENLLGAFQIRSEFYDATYRKVTNASTPGRYGAVVTLTSETGESSVSYHTLYCLDAKVDLATMDFGRSTSNLTLLGIDPGVCVTQDREVQEFLRESIRGHLETQSGAVTLAGLVQTVRDDPPYTQRNDPWRRNQNWWYGLRKQLGDPGLPYYVFTPSNYDSGTNRWPMILFLHGAGERGRTLGSVRKVGLPRLLEARKDFPFVVVVPQCPPNEWWFPAPLLDILDTVQSKYRVDTNRVYLTGLSMGGFGTWALLAESAGRFAAAAPICGGGDPSECERFSQVPVWVFHGAKDSTVPLVRSEEMVKALEKLGATVSLTIYPDAGHNSWDETYKNEHLYEWFLANRRGVPAVPPPTDRGGGR